MSDGRIRAPAHGQQLESVAMKLFLLGGREVRLPCRDLTARRRGDDLGLLLLWLLGFAIASLLALGHLGPPWFASRANPVHQTADHQTADPAVRRAYPHVHVALLQEPPARSATTIVAANIEIEVDVFTDPADQAATHAARRLRAPRGQVGAEQSQAARSTRSDGIAARELLAFFAAGALVTLSHRYMPSEIAVINDAIPRLQQ